MPLDQKSTEDLYESLAMAIDSARGDVEGNAAEEIESQFLAKLAFLALRDIADDARRQELIRIAGLNLG